MNKTPLDEYKTTIDKVFTYENLTAILAVLQSFKPRYEDRRIKESEFETIRYNAEIDGMNYMTEAVVEFVNKRGILPVNLPK